MPSNIARSHSLAALLLLLGTSAGCGDPRDVGTAAADLSHAEPRGAALRIANPAERQALPEVVDAHGIGPTILTRFAPTLLLHPDETFFPCSIEALLAGANLRTDAGLLVQAAPLQGDLLRHHGAHLRLQLAPHAIAPRVQPALDGPLYVSTQWAADGQFVDLTYYLLFAYQGAQPWRIGLLHRAFHAILPPFGEHEGDLESVTLRLDADLTRVLAVRLEAHCQSTWMRPTALAWEDTTHAKVRVALHTHALYSGADQPSRGVHLLRSFSRLGSGADAVDLTADDGPAWRLRRPEQLRRVGLDALHQPIGDQLWSAYAGKLGQPRHHILGEPQPVGKVPLSPLQRRLAHGLAGAAVRLGLTQAFAIGPPPVGLGARPRIYRDMPASTP